MFRIPSLFAAVLALAALLPAQQSLSDLRAQLDVDRESLIREKQGRPTFADIQKLGERHARLIADWLPTAGGAEAVNGRLLLADILRNIGQEDRARAVLKALDVDKAPAIELAAAAQMAGMLGLDAERTAWIDAAVAKDAPFDERMTLAMLLMTRLVEVQKGERIFTDALASAKDDEERAKVGWYRASALREREDLDEGAYATALDELAKKYPDTYWGGVARDRRKAFDLDVGVAAIPFEATLSDGAPVKLADYEGKVLLLDFWASVGLRSAATKELPKLLAEYGERGLAILGVAMDADRPVFEAAAKQAGKTWPQVFDGRGPRTDLALRYGIEHVPDFVLIGRGGRIAATRIYLEDESGVRELRDAIERALSAK